MEVFNTEKTVTMAKTITVTTEMFAKSLNLEIINEGVGKFNFTL